MKMQLYDFMTALSFAVLNMQRFMFWIGLGWIEEENSLSGKSLHGWTNKRKERHLQKTKKKWKHRTVPEKQRSDLWEMQRQNNKTRSA